MVLSVLNFMWCCEVYLSYVDFVVVDLFLVCKFDDLIVFVVIGFCLDCRGLLVVVMVVSKEVFIFVEG